MTATVKTIDINPTTFDSQTTLEGYVEYSVSQKYKVTTETTKSIRSAFEASVHGEDTLTVSAGVDRTFAEASTKSGFDVK